jgi:hypothetical protein
LPKSKKDYVIKRRILANFGELYIILYSNFIYHFKYFIEEAPMKVGIVGGGKAGTLFLKALLDIPEVDVIGVCDKKPEAPAIIFAEKQGIPTYFDLKLFLENDMDVVLELTGIPAVRDTIEQLKKQEAHLMDSMLQSWYRF